MNSIAKADKDSVVGSIMRALQELEDDVRLLYFGGHPSIIDGDTIAGWVVIASTNEDGKPELGIYRWADLVQWWVSALDYTSKNPEVDFIDAMRELEPHGIRH